MTYLSEFQLSRGVVEWKLDEIETGRRSLFEEHWDNGGFSQTGVYGLCVVGCESFVHRRGEKGRLPTSQIQDSMPESLRYEKRK